MGARKVCLHTDSYYCAVMQRYDGVVLNSLPARVLSRLQELGRKYSSQGVELFVFGSHARKDPRPNSDLDLGVEWHRPVSRTIFREICEDIDDLPTIRKVDLVDFSKVSPAWREVAERDRVMLPEK